MRSCSLVLLLLALVALTGCEETVPPTLDTGRPFTLWGALNPSAEIQAVRVVPIQLTIDANVAGPLDAEFVTTNLDTGERVVWRDSVVQFPRGDAGDVFIAPFQPGYGEAYEVVATRSDGATSTARIVTPPLIEPVRLQPEIGPGRADQRLLWPEAPRLNDVEIEYSVRDINCNSYRMTLPAPSFAEPFEFGWQVTLPYNTVRDVLAAEVGTSQITLLRVTVRALVTDANWKPPFGFGFDDDLIIQPGTVSNVENGFGFVGAAYPSAVSWNPEVEVLRAARFVEPGSIRCG